MNSNEIAKAYNDGSSQFTYFLAAAAGAGIGYALTKLDGQLWSPRMVLGLAALGLWLLSFFSGCMLITWGLKVLTSNHIFVSLQEGSHPKQPSTKVELQVALDVTTKAMERKVTIAKWFKTSQVWSLYLGVLVFTAWRLFEMFSPNTGSLLSCALSGFSI